MDYDVRARATAGGQLAPKAGGGKGQAVVLTASTGVTYDTATGAATGAGNATQNGSGIEIAYTAREIDGETIVAGDRKFMLSPLKTDGTPITMPSAGHTLTLADGSVWRIVTVEVFSPAGTPVYATLQLRRA